VFDRTATNERVYGTVVRDLIGAVVGGFNATAFAYGQTSSGKTFTMNGSDADPGIIPRAVRDVFDTVRQVSGLFDQPLAEQDDDDALVRLVVGVVWLLPRWINLLGLGL